MPELGSLLDHTGPIKDAEEEAARNRRRPYLFVTNGTSTANKIVWHGGARRCGVRRSQLPQVAAACADHDRRSTGVLHPSRNAHGIIGPISLDQFTPESLQQRIAANPLASKAYQAGSKPRIAVVTNSTYDGLCYNAEIADEIGSAVDFLHFDEAWYAYAAFHPFYENHYGMAKGKPREQDAIIFTTHSTHKLLAAFSRASMIHVRNSAQRNLDAERFNESFMMHTSTSPHYGVIAACDVASKMMEGDAGRSLVQEMHDEAIAFRRAMLHVRDDLGRDDWWFSVWQPTGRAQPGQGRHAGAAGGQARGVVPAAGRALARVREPGRRLCADRSDQGDPADPRPGNGRQHGQAGHSGGGAEQVPVGPRHHREKTNLYSVLFLFSMGITKGKWSTLVTELMAFRNSMTAMHR